MEKIILIGNKTYQLTSDDTYLDTMGDHFEQNMTALFETLVSSNDVVVDIGANIGLTSILFSGIAKKVISFEPSPSTYKFLVDNLSRAAANNVEPVNSGLGNKIESSIITFAKNNRSGGFVSENRQPVPVSDAYQIERINIDTLDHFFNEYPIQPTFLKIDVEGFEQNVIKGGINVLQSCKPTVVMEMNHFCLDVLHGITVPDFLDYMRSVFPYLYAVDADNSTIGNLHQPEQAYMVMYEHVIHNRFPNLVGGFSLEVELKLNALVEQQLPLENTSGKLTTERIPVQVEAGDTFWVAANIFNQSEKAWFGYGINPVFAAYHWQAIDDKSYLIFDGVRTRLPVSSVQAGQSIKISIKVQAPDHNHKGKFKLILTLVQEGCCWFEDKGFEATSQEVEVI
jgi:FkbM family methyltransferase